MIIIKHFWIVLHATEIKSRDSRLEELTTFLLSRNYKPGLIRAAIENAKNIPRSEALTRVEKSTATRRPVFVLHHDPRLP